MTLVVTEKAKVRCSHGMGRSKPISSRPFLRIGGAPVVTGRDLSGDPIRYCPNIGPTVVPCRTTLALAAGTSGFVFANGRALALDGAWGPSDGIPPGAVTFAVRDPGQEFVHVSA